MLRSLPAPVAEYFSRLQEERSFTGLEEFHRRQGRVLHQRTIYRWHRRYAGVLVVFPSFAIEALGLAHVHLFVVQPSRSWSRFPYAVEQSWLSPDFSRRVLYLHCIVPVSHLALVEELVRELQSAGWCSSHVWLRSASGWQGVRFARAPVLEAPDLPAADGTDLVHEYPLVIPAVLEAWNTHPSLPRLWERVREHLGPDVRGYFRRRRVHLTNGKSDLREAYERLSMAGLFRQQVFRGRLLATGNVELFLMMQSSPDRVLEFTEACRASARTIETYECARGRWLVRLVGDIELLNAIIQTSPPGKMVRVFFVDQFSTYGQRAVARFCYEFLFNPKTSSWVFPRDQIIMHMTKASP